MARLGKVVIGLTAFAVNNSAIAYVSGPYTACEDGTIDSISAYVASHTDGVSLRLGVYEHDENHVVSSRPTTLVASSNLTALSATGWQTLVRASGTGASDNAQHGFDCKKNQRANCDRR